MSTAKTAMAHRLIPHLTGGGYLMADGNYDSSELFDDAWQRPYQLLMPLPKRKPGSGGHYQIPYRLRSIAMMQGELGPDLYAERGAIERHYGNATSFGSGLAPLPTWVRDIDRMRTWMWAKLLINAARILLLKDLR